ncbi:hypothetical protein KCU90_g3806, partial [Aureobasidium melanogenum]
MRTTHVDLHPLDRMHLLAGVHLLQYDLDTRIVRLETAHSLRHATVQHRIHEADPQAASQSVRRSNRNALCLAGLQQQAARLAKQHLPGVRQRHRLVGACKQLHTQLVLELADVETERRLRNEQPLGRAAEMQFLGDRHEIA